MSDWTAGYVAEIDYTYGYYGDLNPLQSKLAFLSAGLAPPQISTACELGFGQGVSINAHAASTSVAWYGTDFNPSQAAFAQEMANASGAKAFLSDEDFAAFTAREDLPQFDFIGLHGIWSWISDQNRHLITDFIRRRLKVGGVLYISYNTLPGWGAFAPVRHLLSEHVSTVGDGQGIVSRVDGSIEFAEKLLEVQPLFSQANPQIAERVAKLKNQSRHYLAHEYFNQDWLPMHFGTISKWLQEAKLTFACSARLGDHIDSVNLKPDQKAFLADIPNPSFRESVRDFIVNRQFRADYWVKGPRRLNDFDRDEALRETRVILTTLSKDVPMKVSGSQGNVNLLKGVYKPILKCLVGCQIKSLGELEQEIKPDKISFRQLVETILLLINGGHMSVAQDAGSINAAKSSTDKLNEYIMNKARGGNDVQYLVSPVAAGGISVSRFDQLFLLALKQGNETPNEIAKYAWQVLEGRGLKVISEGEMLSTPKENLAHLEKLAIAFQQEKLLIYEGLQLT